jgi:ribosome maturation factor RimP
MDLSAVSTRVGELAKEIAQKGGFEFVRSEIAGTKRSPLIRVFIDKPEGLTVEHCAEVSREIDARMEAEDLIPTKYVLEVSSPGLERELFSMDDFRRFAGKLAKIKTTDVEKGSKTTVGRIKEVDGESIIVTLRGDEDVTIPFSAVVKANLKIDLDEEFRKR